MLGKTDILMTGVMLYAPLISIPSLGSLVSPFIILSSMCVCWLWLREKGNIFTPIQAEEITK